MWAYRVQQAVRSRQALPSPCRPPRYLALGFDGRGLAAVVHYHVLGGDFFLSLVGVAQRCRRAGGVVADEAMTLMMDRVTAYGVENGLESVWISGNVDRENRASKACWRGMGGFTRVGSMGSMRRGVVMFRSAGLRRREPGGDGGRGDR